MINDGNFHFHYPYRASDSDIFNPYQLDRLDKIIEENGVDKIAGIFTFENSGIVDKICERYKVFPGVYISLDRYTDKENREEELLRKNRDKFEFVKIHHWLGAPYHIPEMLEKVIEDSVSYGIKKFSIHTETLDDERLDMLAEFVKDYDVILYLAHGANAVYGYGRKPTVERLKGLEGNLLLGTSSHSGVIELPNERIKKAVDDGLENMVAFESNFELHWIYDENYGYTIRSITEGIGNNKKILHDNLETFFE